MKTQLAILLFAAAVALVSASDYDINIDDPISSGLHYEASEVKTLFSAWKAQHNKKYESVEEHYKRFGIFFANLEKIHKHNADKTQTFKMAMNHFGDLTGKEFKAMYANADLNKRPKSFRRMDVSGLKAASEVDWTSTNNPLGLQATTPVKNQGQCGSCWSFSSTGGLEGAYATENKVAPISLSEQNLMDCSWSEGNNGCNGGLMDNAFAYVQKKGICSEESYPYTAESSQTCKQCTPVVKITGHQDVPQADQAAFDAALSKAPISIAIEADQQGFQFYSSGIMSAACGTALDHGVLAVAVSASGGYYKVKNSWGTTWGENGFIRLARGSQYNNGQGQCGMFLAGSQPTGATSA